MAIGFGDNEVKENLSTNDSLSDFEFIIIVISLVGGRFFFCPDTNQN